MMAAPRPWNAREVTSIAVDVDKPQRSDVTENNASPIMNIRRRPRRSPARPPRSRKPPKVIAYAVRTHWRLDADRWSDRAIEGSATVTMDTSSTVMKNATQTRARACHRRGSGAVKEHLQAKADQALAPAHG
jgi:hypothetical protein